MVESDALAVQVTARRRAYLRALMAFADVRPLAGAAAFGWRHQLFRRMVQIGREDVMSSSRLVASFVTLTLLVGISSWSAVRAFPLTDVQALPRQAGPGPLEQIAKPAGPGNPVPQQIGHARLTFPEDHAAREMAATVVLRTTVDQAGAVGKLEAVFEQAEGRANAPSVAAARYRPAIRAFIESTLASARERQYASPSAGPVTFDLAVMFDGGQAVAGRAAMSGELTQRIDATAASQPSPLADGALKVGHAICPPRKTRDWRPVYPAEARAANVQGVVILEVRIEGDGRVSQARILGSIPMLDQAALDAVKEWQFEPTLLNGAPTPVVMTVTIQFTL